MISYRSGHQKKFHRERSNSSQPVPNLSTSTALGGDAQILHSLSFCVGDFSLIDASFQRQIQSIDEHHLQCWELYLRFWGSEQDRRETGKTDSHIFRLSKLVEMPTAIDNGEKKDGEREMGRGSFTAGFMGKSRVEEVTKPGASDGVSWTLVRIINDT